mmetsp:Transcript_71535/g.155415  ORF Transcript_71535/g.155415 Transcript_71535/m.155415 type:complete len:942 (-) Transcript_71535:64-2889(-)
MMQGMERPPYVMARPASHCSLDVHNLPMAQVLSRRSIGGDSPMVGPPGTPSMRRAPTASGGLSGGESPFTMRPSLARRPSLTLSGDQSPFCSGPPGPPSARQHGENPFGMGQPGLSCESPVAMVSPMLSPMASQTSHTSRPRRMSAGDVPFEFGPHPSRFGLSGGESPMAHGTSVTRRRSATSDCPFFLGPLSSPVARNGGESPSSLLARASAMSGGESPYFSRQSSRTDGSESPFYMGKQRSTTPRHASEYPWRTSPGVCLTEEEIASGLFSMFDVRATDVDGAAPWAVIAPQRAQVGHARELPTILAISGEEQAHVSKFVRAWRAEERGWQVVVPLRSSRRKPLFFEEGGVEAIILVMREIIGNTDREAVPFDVESQKLHLVGNSNGGAAVLAVAARVPELVASVTVVTGFAPPGLTDYWPLRDISHIHFYVGDADELGHCAELQEVAIRLEAVGAQVDFTILPGAGHFNIGQAIDMETFWQELGAARNSAKAKAPWTIVRTTYRIQQPDGTDVLRTTLRCPVCGHEVCEALALESHMLDAHQVQMPTQRTSSIGGSPSGMPARPPTPSKAVEAAPEPATSPKAPAEGSQRVRISRLILPDGSFVLVCPTCQGQFLEESSLIEHIAESHGRALALPGGAPGGESGHMDLLHQKSSEKWHPRRDEVLSQLHVISLGSFCGVKFSIQRLGLGQAHLPFDWIRSTSSGVRSFVRRRFSNFFSVTSRQDVPGTSFTVHRSDKHSFWHNDITREEERELLRRRVDRFLAMRDDPKDLLFVRSVASTEELAEVEDLYADLSDRFVKSARRRVLLVVVVDGQATFSGPIAHRGLPGVVFYAQPLAEDAVSPEGDCYTRAITSAVDLVLRAAASGLPPSEGFGLAANGNGASFSVPDAEYLLNCDTSRGDVPSFLPLSPCDAGMHSGYPGVANFDAKPLRFARSKTR